MATSGYSGTPLWKKLGYGPGAAVLALGMPAEVRTQIEAGSTGIKWLRQAKAPIAAAHLFVTERAELERQLGELRDRLAPTAMVWVSWPKKSSGVAGDLDENAVRAVALAVRLVDVKVCAVTEIWSGLKLVIRLSDRKAP